MKTGNCTHIGRYEIRAEIGRGAMGLVYQAHDPKIDRLVAIKTIFLLTQEIEEEEEFRERFFLEAKAAGRLVHPGIVTIFDVGEDPENHEPYIVMEFVAGQSLNRILVGENKKLPLGPVLQITQEIAEALNYAHSQNVIHRDIKPANILITLDGHAKIADFGIAKLNQGLMTLPGQVLGSPAYMAPEQLSGESSDARSDLFSLGVILYSMLTGFRPFQGNSTATVSFKVVNRDPLPVTSFDSEFPAELDRLVSRAIAKDPEQRYQSGQEMAQDIQRMRERLNLLEQTAASIPSVTDPEAATIRQLARSATPRPAVSTGSEANSNRVSSSGSSSTRKDWSQPQTGSKLALQKPQTGKRAPLPKELVLTAAGVLLLAIIFIAMEAIGPAKQKTAAGSRHGGQNSVETKALIAQSANIPPGVSSTADQPPTKRGTDRLKEKSITQISRPKPSSKIMKTVVKAPIPAKYNVPAKVSSAPSPPTPTQPLSSATLQIQIEYQFEEAEASIWVDNQLIYAQKLFGESKKRALLFKKVVGHELSSANIPAGEHRLHVRIVSTTEQYDQSQTIDGHFAANSKNTLSIMCDKRTDSLQLMLN